MSLFLLTKLNTNVQPYIQLSDLSSVPYWGREAVGVCSEPDVLVA